MIAYKTDFKALDKNWHWSYPWGTPDGEQGIVSDSMECLSIIPEGIKLSPFKIQGGYLLPRIFWTGAPFSYGLFEAEMTVPLQSAVPDFVLYSKARYKKAVRSILPEIDIAEFGTKNHPNAINMAVHRWKRKPDFLRSVKYYSNARHELDYVGHIQKNAQIAFESIGTTRRLYQCEVTKRSVKIYINGHRQFYKMVRLDACFTPTFGISVPNHIKNPDPKWMIIHNFKVEQ